MKNAFFLRILALTIAALAAIATPSQAQNQTATLELGADTVEFGSPVELRIVVKSKTGQSVTPPAFRNNTVIPGVEILSGSGAETAATTTSGTQYTFKYSITSRFVHSLMAMMRVAFFAKIRLCPGVGSVGEKYCGKRSCVMSWMVSTKGLLPIESRK